MAGLSPTLGSTALTRAVDAKSIEPLVFLDGRFPVACGFEARVETGQVSSRVSVLNRKTGEGSEFAVSVEGADEVRSLSVSAGDVRDGAGFAPLIKTGNSRFERTRTFTPDDGAMFIQSLMVGGGTLSFELQDRVRVDVVIPGPLPQSVRASYLNCAGDLMRPEG